MGEVATLMSTFAIRIGLAWQLTIQQNPKFEYHKEVISILQ